MQKKQSIAQNFIFNAFLNATKFLFPLITYPYVARVLGPDGSGKVTFATSLIYYFIMFAELGIPTYGIRKCAGVRDDKEKLSRTVHELVGIQAVTSVISYIALFVCIFTVPRLQSDKLLYIVVSSGIFFHLCGMEWLYKGLEQYRYISVRSIVFKIISIIAMFLLVRSKSDYIIYGGITIIASSASYLCNLFQARKLIFFRNMGGYNFRQHLKPVMVFFAMACAVTIYTHIDTLLLGFIQNDTVVGYYNAAIKAKTIMVSLAISLSVVLLPRASYYITNGETDKFHAVSRKSINFSALFTSPFTLYFILFAGSTIDLLAGELYGAAVTPMRLIMPSLLIISLSYPIGMQMLVPLKKEKYVLYSEISGAVINVIVDLLLIPRMGAAGAAIGNVCAEAAVLLVQYLAIRSISPRLFSDVKWLKIGLALAAAAAASFWVLLLDLGPFWKLAISACCFFSAYGIVLLVTKEPMVKEVLGQVMKKLGGKSAKSNSR